VDTQRQKKKSRGRPFAKGNPGRPPGARNKATVEVRDAARALVEDEAYRERLRARLLAGEAGHIETLLWHYAYGKPKDELELLGDRVDIRMCMGHGPKGEHRWSPSEESGQSLRGC
jgi:hypothetical protein